MVKKIGDRQKYQAKFLFSAGKIKKNSSNLKLLWVAF
jgi:hypothetical protein